MQNMLFRNWFDPDEERMMGKNINYLKYPHDTIPTKVKEQNCISKTAVEYSIKTKLSREKWYDFNGNTEQINCLYCHSIINPNGAYKQWNSEGQLLKL